ncbi:MAG: DUF1805 domain-containing protein [Candidatus Omnitrophota bacterium]
MEDLVTGTVLVQNTIINTLVVELNNASLILAVAPKGFLMCGYLDITTAEKLKDAACVITGVKTVEELLSKPVVKLTPAAQTLGITLGMSGRKALEKMI